MIRIDSSACLLAALLLLILPLDWLAALTIAAVIHEASHILVLYLLGGSISKISVRAGGCVIETGSIGEWEQFLSILAGPLGSISLLLLFRAAPKIAICGFLQCLANLIPVLPLDGGRLLRLLFYRFCPDKAEKLMALITIGICMLFVFLAIRLMSAASAGPWPLFLAVIWAIRACPEKFLANRHKSGYNKKKSIDEVKL